MSEKEKFYRALKWCIYLSLLLFVGVILWIAYCATFLF